MLLGQLFANLLYPSDMFWSVHEIFHAVYYIILLFTHCSILLLLLLLTHWFPMGVENRCGGGREITAVRDRHIAFRLYMPWRGGYITNNKQTLLFIFSKVRQQNFWRGSHTHTRGRTVYASSSRSRRTKICWRPARPWTRFEAWRAAGVRRPCPRPGSCPWRGPPPSCFFGLPRLK